MPFPCFFAVFSSYLPRPSSAKSFQLSRKRIYRLFTSRIRTVWPQRIYCCVAAAFKARWRRGGRTGGPAFCSDLSTVPLYVRVCARVCVCVTFRRRQRRLLFQMKCYKWTLGYVCVYVYVCVCVCEGDGLAWLGPNAILCLINYNNNDNDNNKGNY